jgi:hypothetical protein
MIRYSSTKFILPNWGLTPALQCFAFDFLWQRDLFLAIVVATVPPLVATELVLRFADLEALKQSALGGYVNAI